MPLTLTQVRRAAVIQAVRRMESRLTLYLTLVIVLGVAAGVASGLDIRSRASLLDDVGSGRSEPTSSMVQAQSSSDAALEIYRSLSDAEVALARAFLTGASQSSDVWIMYQYDVARAISQLTVVAAASTEASGNTVTDLSINLPLYAGQVQDATLAYNRRELRPDLAHQLGANYLRESAITAREKTLPAAERLFHDETARQTASQRRASVTPWVAILLGTLLVCCLVAVQIYLVRRTRRLFNVGLALATLAAIAAVIWMSVASLTAARLSEASLLDGTAQIEALAAARVTGIQARADELMMLVAHGNGDDYFDQRFEEKARQLAEADGLLAKARSAARQPDTLTAINTVTTAFCRWQVAHHYLRVVDEEGNHTEAVSIAISTESSIEFDSPGELAGKFDSELASAIDLARDRLDDNALGATRALSSADIGIALLMTFSVLGSIVGMRPRIAEYR